MSQNSTATPQAPVDPDQAPPNLTGKVDQDYPLSPVPLAARRSSASLFILIAGFFFTPTMITAAEVAVEFDFGRFVLLTAVSAVVLAVYIALLGLVSARSGLTTVAITSAYF